MNRKEVLSLNRSWKVIKERKKVLCKDKWLTPFLGALLLLHIFLWFSLVALHSHFLLAQTGSLFYSLLWLWKGPSSQASCCLGGYSTTSCIPCPIYVHSQVPLISPWRWWQQGPPKYCYPTTTLHGVTTQKIATWIFIEISWIFPDMKHANRTQLLTLCDELI
jgi:hypothetical protein